MLINNIRPGDRVEITPAHDRTDGKPYISKVEAVINRNTVFVHAPIEKGAIIRLEKGSRYNLHFITNKGMFVFRAYVRELLVVTEFHVVAFTLIDRGERSLRRDFFRFNCTMKVQFTVIKNNKNDIATGMLEGLVRDLGGGGMKMFSVHSIEMNSFIRVTLDLNGKYIMVCGEVLHKVHIKEAALPYQYGVKFTAMPTADQDSIIQYLHMEQRKAISSTK